MISREDYNNLSVAERANFLAEKYNSKELYRRLGHLQDYKMSLYRINEQSDAAYREEEQVMMSISTFIKAIKIAKEKESQND